MEHHVIDMIRFFLVNAGPLGLDSLNQIFVIFGAEPENQACYNGLLVDKRQVSFYPSRSITFDFLKRIRKNDCLVLHSVLFPYIWLNLILWPAIWKRTAIVNWGAGFENLNPTAIKARVNNALRRMIIPRLGAVSTLTPGEYDIISREYGPCNNYVRAIYTATPSSRVNHTVKVNGALLRIQVGHSSDEENEHTQILQWLEAYNNNHIEVICPLSYPIYPKAAAHREKVLETGHRLLGYKFHPILQMMSKDEYKKLLDTIDVFVSNSRIQQGLFNIYYLLWQGKKIFVRKDCPIFNMLHDFDIEVFDTLKIPSQSYQEFSTIPPATSRHNIKQMDMHMSQEKIREGWKELLSRIA